MTTSSAPRLSRTWKSATTTVLRISSTATIEVGAVVCSEIQSGMPTSITTKCIATSPHSTVTTTYGGSRSTAKQGLALAARRRRLEVRQPAHQQPGGDRAQPVDREDGEVGPGLVDPQRDAAERRAEAHRHVGDRPQVRLEGHALAADRDPCDVAVADRARARLQQLHDAHDQHQRPDRADDEQAEEHHAADDGQRAEQLARAAQVAEVADRELPDQAHRRGDRQHQADLGRLEPDHAGEEQCERGHGRAGAGTVDERRDRQDTQVRVVRDPPCRQPGRWVRSLDSRVAHLGGIRMPPSTRTTSAFM